MSTKAASAGQRVRLAYHAHLSDRRVLHQRALHLEGPDEVSCGLDDVVGSADEPHEAVFVDAGYVASEVPTVGERLRIAVGVVEVGPEHRGPART